MSKIFFTSYARDDNRDERLGRAVELLSRRVAAMLGLAAADAPKVAFFDTDDIETGQDWEQRLSEAARTAGILVCLCSPTYLSREYCAKEFEVFRRRVQAAGDAFAGKVAIIPVIWEHGAPRMVLPNVIGRYQWRDDRLPKSYGAEGLSQLARFPSQRDKYLRTVEVLAETIGNAYAGAALPALPGPVKFNELPLWFQNPRTGPYNLRVAVLHAQSTQWKPRLGGGTLGAAVDAVSGPLKMAWEEILPGPDLVESLRKAGVERQICLLVLARGDAEKSPWSTYLAQVDQAALESCAFVVGFPPGTADTAAQLRALLPLSSAGTSFHEAFAADDANSLRQALTRAATQVRAALVARDPAARVEDANLAAAARSAGVPFESKPVLTGPGGIDS